MKTHRTFIPIATTAIFGGLAAAVFASASLAIPAHAAGPVAKYVFAPAPIAPPGSLAANATVAVTLTAEDNLGAGVAGAAVFLSFVPASGGGSAKANGPPAKALTTTPTSYTADASGKIALTYKAPATIPCAGIDTITAQNAAAGARLTKTESYNFSTVGHYAFSARPIAHPGSLGSGASLPITVTAQTRTNAAVPCATIFLSLKSTGPGLGTAKAGTTALTATPQGFHVNASGQVAVTYTASTAATLPSSGTDTLVAQDAAPTPRVSAVDAYSYGHPAHYTFAPNPIAATGTLTANAKVKINLTVTDSGGNIVAGAKVYLFFTQAGGGGSVLLSGHPLTNVPKSAFSDSLGHVTMVYQAPATLPASGTDKITGENLPSGATLTATDSYSFH